MLRNSLIGLNLVGISAYRKVANQSSAGHSTIRQPQEVGTMNFKTRSQHLAEVRENPDFDLLVIGGGISGAGVLLEASRKNLRTLLIDSNDFAGGSSSKSTKLLHGGLRYLENAFKLRNQNRREDFMLVQEALNERNLLLNVAPHLASGIGIVVPTTNIFSCMFYYIGCQVYQNFEKLYAKFTSQGQSFTSHLPFKLPEPRVLFKEELHHFFPNLKQNFKWGVLMWDGQVDDSRLVFESLLTATALNHPGLRQNNAVNFCRLVEFQKDGSGKITGATLEDKLTGSVFQVRAKVAVNATGVMADSVRKLANPDLSRRILASKGDHLTLDNDHKQFIQGKQGNIGLLIPKTKDGRLMFVLPWKDSVIAGTTDRIVEQPTVGVIPDPESTNEIVKSLEEYFQLDKMPVKSRWAGLRPLVMSPPKETPSAPDDQHPWASPETLKVHSKDVKRTHVVEVDDKSGLVSVMGGKLTIFRLMGEDCVAQAMNRMVSQGDLSPEDMQQKLSRSTRNLRLIGDFRPKVFQSQNDQTDPENPEFESRDQFLEEMKGQIRSGRLRLDPDVVDYLSKTYGNRALAIKEKFLEDPNNTLRLDAKYPFTRGELAHLIESEWVVSPAELLTARLRVAFLDAEEARRLLPVVVDTFGDLAGWDDQRKRTELASNADWLGQMNF